MNETSTRRDVSLLILPCVNGTRMLWEPYLDRLSPRTHVDVLDYSRLDSVASMADLAHTSLKHRVRPVVLLGHSLGGYVVLELMRRLLQSQEQHALDGVILANTRAEADTEEGRQARQASIDAGEQAYLDYQHTNERFLSTFGAIHQNNAALRELIIADHASSGGFACFVHHTRACMHRRDSRDVLPAWKGPVLVIGGGEDTLTPLHFQRDMAHALPNATLTEIEDAGHCAHMCNSDAFFCAVNHFLEKRIAAN